MQINWIAALGFGIVIALFAVQNSAPVAVRFLWLAIDAVPISVLVLICATLGALVTLLFGFGREIRHRISLRSTRREARALERRVAELETTIQQLETEKAELRGRWEAYQGQADPLGPAEGLPGRSDPLPLSPSDDPSPLPPPRVGDGGRGSSLPRDRHAD